MEVYFMFYGKKPTIGFSLNSKDMRRISEGLPIVIHHEIEMSGISGELPFDFLIQNAEDKTEISEQIKNLFVKTERKSPDVDNGG